MQKFSLGGIIVTLGQEKIISWDTLEVSLRRSAGDSLLYFWHGLKIRKQYLLRMVWLQVQICPVSKSQSKQNLVSKLWYED